MSVVSRDVALALEIADLLAGLDDSVNLAGGGQDLAHVDLSSLGIRPDKFNMGRVLAAGECGTVCCVLGWSSWVLKNHGLDPEMSLGLNYAWCYDAGWAGLGAGVAGGGGTAQAAAHRIYYELAYGPPHWTHIDSARQNWAGFVSLYPFETCREKAHERGQGQGKSCLGHD